MPNLTFEQLEATIKQIEERTNKEILEAIENHGQPIVLRSIDSLTGSANRELDKSAPVKFYLKNGHKTIDMAAVKFN